MSALKGVPLQQPSSASKRRKLQPSAQTLKAFAASDDEEDEKMLDGESSDSLSPELHKDITELQVWRTAGIVQVNH